MLEAHMISTVWYLCLQELYSSLITLKSPTGDFPLRLTSNTVTTNLPALLFYMGLLKWTFISATVGGTVATGYLTFDHLREIERLRNGIYRSDFYTPWQKRKIHFVPQRTLSRLWGFVNNLYLPKSVRSRFLGWYAAAFNCNLDETVEADLTKYRNLGEFFSRTLKPGMRPISSEPLVSPADGTIMAVGEVTPHFKVQQVKGFDYELETFVGQEYNRYIMGNHKQNGKNNRVFHCTVYLAPGDYHHYHSPVDWKVVKRTHFTGKLLSVYPKFVERYPTLFSVNERVVLYGEWLFGAFTMTLVGATNVGKILVDFDKDLLTNKAKFSRMNAAYHQAFDAVNKEKGDHIGQFKLGSSVVLIFEAPEDFKFEVQPGQVIKYGQRLGTFNNNP